MHIDGCFNYASAINFKMTKQEKENLILLGKKNSISAIQNLLDNEKKPIFEKFKHAETQTDPEPRTY